MSEVAVTSRLPGESLERLARRHTVRAWEGAERPTGAALARFVGSAEGLLCLLADRIGRELLAACPSLRVVANYGVGVDNIDLEAAREAGVWVTNTPDVLTDATADLTWALILAVTRRVVEGDRALRAGGFSGWRPEFMLGAGLQGKTLGIVGMGRIGRAVARRARAFGVRVHYHDPAPLPATEVDGAVYFAELDALLPTVEVLSLHCPLTPTTRHLMDGRRLRLLRRGAFLVNTSRGEVVDEAALVEVLGEGHLGGAGLDVYEREPAVEPGLLSRQDVVLLPHLGSATRETRAAMADLAVANVEAVLEGRVPPTPVVTPTAPRS